MKYLSTLLVASLLFVSCQNVDQYRDQIETLVNSWQETSATANTLANSLEEEQTRAQLALGNMNVPEGFNLSPTALQQANQLKDLVQKQMTKIINTRQDVGAFVRQAQDNTQALGKLKLGLEEGKLPGDVATTLTNLEDGIADAKANLGRWEAKLSEATSQYTDAYKAFNGLFTDTGNE